MGHKIVVERETVRVGDRDQQQAMVKVGDIEHKVEVV